MKITTLEQVNKAVVDLVDAKSEKQLNAQIVEAAKALVFADYGKLYLYNKDHLKRAYYSDELVKKNTLLQNKGILKILPHQKVFAITAEELAKKQMKHMSDKIKLFVSIPLVHAQQPLGFILLFYREEKKSLTANEQELLTLFMHTAVLALTKVQLQEESQKALEIRDRFISLASHELRTPLTSIHGYIQLLHSRLKTDETVESRWVKELFIESIRMTNLVKELLDVNRIKQGQFAFVFSEVPMQEVVNRAIDRYRLTNADHPFILESKLTDGQTTVVGDFDKLVEMVSGLLGNAVKFSKPGEKITVTLTQDTNNISLEVKDNGRGISKKDITAIFSGFYKAEDASHIEGMGVGLLLAQHIIDNHRGKLKIKSKEEKGTSVTVSLPTIKSVH
jgi:signal transduction histidine kinase